MKILLIEDDRDAACMLKLLLEDNHEVFVAYTGKEAIDIGLKHLPNLIISDWNLEGEIDGVSACKSIVESHKAAIIFVSGSPIDQLKEVAEALVPLHILSKPIDLNNLSELIQNIAKDCKSSS